VIACGWDIGGVHLKAAAFDLTGRGGLLAWRQEPFEIWRDPGSLTARLGALAASLPAPADRSSSRAMRHAVTMTAELSDVFPSRAAGVRFILAACRESLGGDLRVLRTSGDLVAIEAARRDPDGVGAANWMATAMVAARALGGSGVLVDTGSTTTDIVPLASGRPAPRGRSDLERLACGELVYSGLLRTPPAALADRVPLRGGWCRTAPEHFTSMADVYVLLGRIDPSSCTVPTPDGRGRTSSECAARLARLVCAEPGDLGEDELLSLAEFLADRQAEGIAAAIREVATRNPGVGRAVVAGAGAILAADAAARAGLVPVRLAELVPGRGDGWDVVAPAACLALLLAEEVGRGAGRVGRTGQPGA
jgi:probable H4MPT-linked C1 transfer pathway protein